MNAPIDRSRVRSGMEVVAADDAHLGLIREVGRADFLLHLAEIRRDFYVPFGHVGRIDHERITLTCRSDEVEMMGWQCPPAGPRVD